MNLTILYRGDLSSCNYDCPYCPFAKHWESKEELQADRDGLNRFCRWVAEQRDDRLSVFFTPWGEALVRNWYRQAIVSLTHLKHVEKVAVQTNLSCSLEWLSEAVATKVGLWCTYHPGQTIRDTFLRQCRQLDELNVSYSVGCVGLREHVTEIQSLRTQLPDSVYLWINAYKSQSDHYDDSTINTFNTFTAIDPLFPVNNTRHPSLGKRCHTGQSVFTVDSRGDMRRCHFVDDVIGNIHDASYRDSLYARACPNETCGCHIGYVHLEELQLYPRFGNGVLERVPVERKTVALELART
ncbi:MAG: radical SAM protein [Planctomycetota bacterium]|nr:MAG: radical SAM protein [Planctomycetota bacterium]REJ86918.1 MAG: radical SAM protein [Planctomycetota bacterium]REK24955.1 MAG: radical SAM protein [Planctomycetota bacterium]REK48544.1 MAG: radical SAM protein [Planctomycetota bacterium]